MLINIKALLRNRELIASTELRADLRTSDTLIVYLPIFQMIPKFSICIRYHWYPI